MAAATRAICACTEFKWLVSLWHQPTKWWLLGGFQLLDLIIPELKSHVIPYKFKSSHWLKLQHSDWRANLVKDFFLQINFPPMRALEFIRDHMTFKLRYIKSSNWKPPWWQCLFLHFCIWCSWTFSFIL